MNILTNFIFFFYKRFRTLNKQILLQCKHCLLATFKKAFKTPYLLTAIHFGLQCTEGQYSALNISYYFNWREILVYKSL